MTRKKITIIGAGMAGLTAGCYLQMNGFETEIFEKHSNAGGLCTSWERDGYTFDGSIQWVLGTRNGSVFYKIWSELLDIKHIDFVDHDVAVEIELKNHKDKNGDCVFHVYTYLNKFKTYLKDIAPEDEEIIDEMANAIRKIQSQPLPPMILKAPEIRSFKDKAGLWKKMPLINEITDWIGVSNYQFAARFKNPFVKEAFELLYDGEEHTILTMFTQLAYFDLQCVGYPVGGSKSFVKHVEDRYLELGGKINYSEPVMAVMLSNNRTMGIKTAFSKEVKSDAVISAADWKYTVFDLLDGQYVDNHMLGFFEEHTEQVLHSGVLISMGVEGNFDHLPHLIRFPIEYELETPDGTRYNRMELHVYNYDNELAGKGKTVMSVMLPTQRSDYWIRLRTEDYGRYAAEKKGLAQQVIDIIEGKFGGIRENIEVIDIATPATFQRFTNNWQGNIQGWFPPEELFSQPPFKKELPGLKGFYMIGHWMEPGEVLPTAVKTGREVAQLICKREGIAFHVERMSEVAMTKPVEESEGLVADNADPI